MEKYWTAGCLIISSLVTSFQERQWHWQFALQFLFPALHGQWPRLLFRTQAPLHGQETSTDPWPLVLFNKDGKLQFKKNWRMDENMVDQHFHLLWNARLKRNMEKYWTAGCLIISSLVTSFQERQWHWQFALQFLFPALHGQWPRLLFRTQAPLHGQETSTDPWPLVLFNKDGKLQFKKNWRMDENMVDQHFHLLWNARKDFCVTL